MDSKVERRVLIVKGWTFKRGHIRSTRDHEPRRMPNFESLYTDEQREAMALAFDERMIRPAARVVALAKTGELEPGLAPFETNANSVRSCARYRRRRLAGKKKGKLSEIEPGDANEIIRRRLINASEWMLSRVERQQHAKAKPNLPRMAEELRQVARCHREIMSLPGPGEPRPVSLGQHDPAKGKPVTGKLTGRGAEILEAIRSNGAASPAQSEDTTHTQAERDAGAAQRNTETRADAVRGSLEIEALTQ